MEIAYNLFKRIFGLMFRKNGEMIFVFEKDVDHSVWTPFMNFPIDVFFLNKNFEVVDVKRDLKPWKIYKPLKKYRYFFESERGKYTEKSVSKMVKKQIVKNNKKH